MDLVGLLGQANSGTANSSQNLSFAHFVFGSWRRKVGENRSKVGAFQNLRECQAELNRRNLSEPLHTEKTRRDLPKRNVCASQIAGATWPFHVLAMEVIILHECLRLQSQSAFNRFCFQEPFRKGEGRARQKDQEAIGVGHLGGSSTQRWGIGTLRSTTTT